MALREGPFRHHGRKERPWQTIFRSCWPVIESLKNQTEKGGMGLAMARPGLRDLNPLARVGAYLRKDARPDAVSGLTVAIMGVPQAMAYALIAGLPPIYGLYTAIVTCVVAALVGSSNHLVTGPTNALCMVILSLTAPLPAKYGLSLFEIILLLTFLTGLIQLGFGLLRMGTIVMTMILLSFPVRLSSVMG